VMQLGQSRQREVGPAGYCWVEWAARRGRKGKKEEGESGPGGENERMTDIGNRILYNCQNIFPNCKLI
jgi:hypothetical protein